MSDQDDPVIWQASASVNAIFLDNDRPGLEPLEFGALQALLKLLLDRRGGKK